MQRLSSGILVLILVLASAVSFAQDTSKVTSVDPDLLALQNAKVPKEYTIATVNVTGLTTLDSSIVRSIANIQPGDKVAVPGGDLFSKAINNLWRQKLFSNVQIYITGVHEDKI